VIHCFSTRLEPALVTAWLSKLQIVEVLKQNVLCSGFIGLLAASLQKYSYLEIFLSRQITEITRSWPMCTLRYPCSYECAEHPLRDALSEYRTYGRYFLQKKTTAACVFCNCLFMSYTTPWTHYVLLFRLLLSWTWRLSTSRPIIEFLFGLI
jgi:hypothetical protein